MWACVSCVCLFVNLCVARRCWLKVTKMSKKLFGDLEAVVYVWGGGKNYRWNQNSIKNEQNIRGRLCLSVPREMGLISMLPKARKKFTTNFTPLAEYSLSIPL